jgi:hypothetical protein
MSKIPYRYRTPIPMVFWKNGYLDPSKKIYKNRLAFLTWAFSECNFGRFEFSCSREEAALKSGLTIQEWRTQEQNFIEEGFLIKHPNQVHDRFSVYHWNVEKLVEEKIIEVEKTTSQNPSQTSEDEKDKTPLKEEATSQTENQPAKQPVNQPAVLREEIQKNNQPINQAINHFYINDNKAINLSLSNSDNEYKPRAREDISLSSKRPVIAFSNQRVFNPKTYRLRNGDLLTPRMQGALGKYVGNARERLLANISHYEEWVDSGGIIKESHEAYLQTCIKYDYAKKKDYSMQNDLYVRFLKEENNLKQIEILKTVVKIRITENGAPESISKELHPKTFADTLENFIRNNDAKVKNG